jgi:ADP-ribosylglycohydrolase
MGDAARMARALRSPGALWTAVSRFGDCDTLGAIVGSIVALHPGAEIPEPWRQRRERLV